MLTYQNNTKNMSDIKYKIVWNIDNYYNQIIHLHTASCQLHVHPTQYESTIRCKHFLQQGFLARVRRLDGMEWAAPVPYRYCTYPHRWKASNVHMSDTTLNNIYLWFKKGSFAYKTLNTIGEDVFTPFRIHLQIVSASQPSFPFQFKFLIIIN